MSKVLKILKYLLILILVASFTGCGTSNSYLKKRKSSSKVSTSQLGRNRYYFSGGYQKKLVKSYHKKRY
jgi:uncharacterized protein YxeA